MLFTEENIKKYNLVFTESGNFYNPIKNVTYYYHYACDECGYPHLNGKKDSQYCDKKCLGKNSHLGHFHTEEWKLVKSVSMQGIKNHFFGKSHTEESKSKRRATYLPKSGKDNPSWKGGYLSIPLYDTYTSQLIPYDECRRNAYDSNILEVRCTYCGKWYIPILSSIKNRINFGINYNDRLKLYCSDSCKLVCPLYWKTSSFLIKQDMIRAGLILPEELNREVQPELRKIVLARDNYICQMCGKIDIPLHCHHIEPVTINPIESADIDNCITLCVECHKYAHTLPGCTYNELRECTNAY